MFGRCIINTLIKRMAFFSTHVSVLVLLQLGLSNLVHGLDACSEATLVDCGTATTHQSCDGPYGLTWKGYTSCDVPSQHFHFDAIADIPTLLATDIGDDFRAPTIKELITVLGYNGTTLPIVESWLVASGYLVSSTYGTTTLGVKTVMAVDLATREVVELPLMGSDTYYLMAVKVTP